MEETKGTPFEQNSEQEEPTVEGEEKPKEEAEEDTKEKNQPVEGLECKHCGGPVKEFEAKDGTPRYYCLDEKKITTAVPQGEGDKEEDEEPPSSEGKIKEEDVVGKTLSHGDFLENFLEDFEVSDSFIKLYRRRYERRGTLPTPQTLAADLMDMPSQIGNKRYASYIAEEYQAELESKGYLDNEEQSTMRSDINLNPRQGPSNPQQDIPLGDNGKTKDLKNIKKMADEAGWDMDETMDKMLNYQMKLQLMNSLSSGDFFGNNNEPSTEELAEIMRSQNDDNVVTREELLQTQRETVEKIVNKLSEKEEEDKLTQILESFDKRLSAIEQQPVATGPPQGNGSSELDVVSKKVRDSLGDIIEQRIRGENGQNITPDTIKSIVNEATSSVRTGERNQYDMEVEKAKIMSEAQKAEAQAKEKGFSELAKAINDGMSNLGWNIGAGAAEGAGAQNPSPQANQPQPQEQVQLEPNPVRYENGMKVTKCPYTDCDARIEMDEGQARTTCPQCGRQVFIQPTKTQEQSPDEVQIEEKAPVQIEEEEPEEVEEPDIEISEEVEDEPEAETETVESSGKVCPECGTELKEYDSGRGKRYRCPQCNVFRKPADE